MCLGTKEIIWVWWIKIWIITVYKEHTDTLTLSWSAVMAMYRVCFVSTPLALAGASQATKMVVGELTTALMPAGLSGTVGGRETGDCVGCTIYEPKPGTHTPPPHHNTPPSPYHLAGCGRTRVRRARHPQRWCRPGHWCCSWCTSPGWICWCFPLPSLPVAPRLLRGGRARLGSLAVSEVLSCLIKEGCVYVCVCVCVCVCVYVYFIKVRGEGEFVCMLVCL